MDFSSLICCAIRSWFWFVVVVFVFSTTSSASILAFNRRTSASSGLWLETSTLRLGTLCGASFALSCKRLAHEAHEYFSYLCRSAISIHMSFQRLRYAWLDVHPARKHNKEI